MANCGEIITRERHNQSHKTLLHYYCMNKVDRVIVRSQRVLYSLIHQRRDTEACLDVLCAIATPGGFRAVICTLVKNRETGCECSLC